MQNMDKRFHALSNKHRLAIFNFLRREELACADSGTGCNVGDIAQQFDLALSTVSHHLKVLQEADLIKCEQRGQFVCCAINRRTVDELQAFFANVPSKKTSATT
jgi:ArsR family transcriptional regulator